MEKKSSNDFRMLYVGKLLYSKGVDLLLKAVSEIREKCIVHIVGNGPLMSMLTRLRKERRMFDRVLFHGYVLHPELPRFYQMADVFVHPARWPEPLGRTLIEAMQFGLPIIAPDIGAPKEICGDACVTFRSGDQQNLKLVIEQLMADRSRRAKMSRVAKARAKLYRPEKIVSKLEHIYDQLVARTQA
jgi:glycosyltransferase involved in cell wall biosynthesis